MTANVMHSLLSTETIRDCMENYQLNKAHIALLTRGFNDTYHVKTAEADYVFRVYRAGHRDEAAVRFELEALNYLRQNGLAVSSPVAKKDGSYLNEIAVPEGTRYGVLFTYAEGERPQINETNAELLGAALGKIHCLTSDFQPASARGFSLDMNHLLDEPAAIISPVVQAYLGDDAAHVFDRVVESVKKEMDVLDPETGFCHGEFHNHHIHKHQGQVEVFGFNGCAIGFRAYDIAVCWWNLLDKYRKHNKANWDAFLKGYRTERAIREADLQSLPLFITARRIRLMGNLLANQDVWGTNWLNERNLKLFIGQLRTDRVGDGSQRDSPFGF